MNYRSKVRYSKLALGLAVALASATAFAQQTAANIGGRVTTAEQAVVAGAQVTITHLPSGTVSQATTDANGRYVARGLRVGGPYTITITKDGKTETIENVFLTLAQTTQVDATVGAPMAAATTLETVEVTAAIGGPASPFSATSMGAGTTIVREQIENLPSVRRSIEDFVRLDPRIVQVDKERGGIAAAGQNSRYNNVRIDGVPTNDQFGLNDNGLPSLNQPISIDWIQEFNVGISDYDVTQTDFVGANINAVSKSGGNEFSGGVYYIFRNDDMVGDLEDNRGRPLNFTLVDETTSGVFLGGPLLKDRLFFFAGYEEFKRTSRGADNGIAGSGALNEFRVTQAQIEQIRTGAAARGIADIGSFDPVQEFQNTDEKWFAKLDLNISDAHRATLRYNKTEGTELQSGANRSTLRASSNFFSQNIGFESWAALLYSDWTDVFSTEANVSFSKYDSRPTSFSNFSNVSVTVPNGDVPGASASGNAFVNIGQERSRQANRLGVDTLTGYFAGNLFLGDHEIKFGVDYESSDVYNLFLQDAIGTYDYTLANWINPTGLPSRYRLQLPLLATPGGDPNGPRLPIDTVAAQFDVGSIGVFVQDTWAVNYNLTLVYGLRADQTQVGSLPAANAGFRSVYGIDNQNTPDGEWLIQPRFGFNYTFDSDLQSQLRGGVGLFRGSAPGVWVSNSFSNPGVLVNAFDINTLPTGTTINLTRPGVPATQVPSQLVNAMADDFRQPSVWRANLAFEQELPFMGLIAGAELLLTQTRDAVQFQNIALGNATGALPDGRVSFWSNSTATGFSATGGPLTGNRARAGCLLVNPALPFSGTTNPCRFTNAVVLANSTKGSASNLTFSLEKPWQDNWYARVGYTLGRSEDVSPGTSSVALSNWQNRVVFNPNENIASTSNYEISDRLTAAFSYRFEFFGEDAPTTVSAFYEGRYGRPFSYVFGNDANGDGEGNGATARNDLFFVPRQGQVAFTTASTAADQQAFWDYISSTPGLARFQGGTAERNSDRSPWRNVIDVRLSQKLPLGWKEARAELFFDIENFGNLLNKDWGRVDEAAFPYNLQVANFAGVNAQGQWVYDVSNYVIEAEGNRLNAPNLPVRNFESRWAAQVGIRIDF